jgi:hypothetical protein
MLKRWISLAAAATVGLGTPVLAQSLHRLDSAASPRQQVQALQVSDEHGQPLELNPFAQQANARFGRVEYRLSTAAFLGQRVRIDLVLPPFVQGLQRPNGLLFRWRGLEGAMDGQLLPGQRHPIWSGTLQSAPTTLAIELDMQLDLSALGRWNGGTFGVEPTFELVVLP